MKLRSHLLVLTLCTLVPMALFAVAGAYLLIERERDAFRRGAIERARAVMTAIDAEIKGSMTTLEAMATLPALDGADVEALRPFAARILDTQPGWLNIVLSSAEGRPIVNLKIPPGERPPEAPERESIVRVAQGGLPAVGDMTMAPVFQRLVFPLRAPVTREGKTRYVLTAVIDPASVRSLLDRQDFPRDWAVGVFDRKLAFVARNREPPGGARHASESLQKTLATSREGWNEGTILEGVESFRAYTTSGYSGWAISIAMPKSTVTRAAVGAAWLLALGVLLAVLAGGVLALVMARRITRPIAALAAAAPTLGQGRDPAAQPDSRVDEVRELATVLQDVGRASREREAALLAADRAKDEFLAMLGHELRNPLATLSTAAELLKLGRGQPGVLDNAQALIARQTAQMAHLVDDLLEVARVTGGKIRLDRAPLDLAALVARVAAGWRSAGRLGAHRLVESLQPAWILGDAARVEQIVANLLDNAVKYTPPQGRVSIAVRRAGEHAVLEVADDGEGLAPDLIERVFDLFVQGERGLAREKGGLGIGLTLVKRLADLHGGSVRAASAGPGHGATFTVTFPAIEAQAAAAPTALAAAGARRNVLLVDDNQDGRESLARLLEFWGHRVRIARDGAEAVRLAAEERPEVALVDIGLPDISGYEVAEKLRGQPDGARILLAAITGYGRDQDRDASRKAGFDAHLTKPVELADLEKLFASLPARAPGGGLGL